jgi:hypothetical protein
MMLNSGQILILALRRKWRLLQSSSSASEMAGSSALLVGLVRLTLRRRASPFLRF